MKIENWIKNKQIGVLYGGLSAERAISVLSGMAVLKALKKLKLNAIALDVDRNIAEKIKKNRIDFAFIALHGPWGEDGTVQGMLDIMGIPYSGDGVLANAVAINKIYSKFIFVANRIPTPKWKAVSKGMLPGLRTRFPIVVKPSSQGSAIGVSIIKNKKDLVTGLKEAFKYGQEVILEEYIRGTEVTVGILGDIIFPVIEIVPKGNFYDFDSKYKPGCSTHIIPPRLPKNIVKKAREVAFDAFKSVGCKVLGRVDLIVDKNGKPWVLEINTIPGMTETSLLPDAARKIGMDFNELVLNILKYSCLKYQNIC
ncbi:MAG: D-alanine--D-alanine ligase [Elusimicrobia bacterium]|nr:D-alanine--D-alanine ligase [Candidatus Liberimonas magnetica]